MKTRFVAVGFLTVLSVGVATLAGPGCSPTLLQNLTAPLNANVSLTFVNDTQFRASFTYGIFSDLDRDPPGAVNFVQHRLEAGVSTTPNSLGCNRDVSIGTAKLLQRVLDTNADQNTLTFDEDAFSVTVNFSNAPADSDLAAAATAGTAAGITKLVGVDFSCGDELIFTFRQDPDAEGGFRIDFVLIHDDE